MPQIRRIFLAAFGTSCLVFFPAIIYGQSLQENAGGKPNQGAKATVESSPSRAVEHDPHSWKEFADERAMFSIMFPGTPVEEDNSSDKIAGRKFTLKTSAFYSVGYQDWFSSNEAAEFENNVELRKQLFDKIRDGIRDAIQTQTKVSLLEEADISINGYPGRSEKLSLENGDVYRQHSYLVGKRIYQIFVITPKELLAPDSGRFDEIRATKFLTSFKLAHPKNNEERKQLDSSPNSAKNFLNSCLVRYQQKDWDRAIADCSKAIELDPQARDSYLMRGMILRDIKGNLDGAIADFDKAIKVDPTFAMAYSSRAWVRYKRNDLDGAIADQSVVIEKDPSADSYHQRGLFRLAKGDLDNAIGDFNVAVEKSPGLVYPYALRAKAKFIKRDFDGSIADFGMVIKLDPKSSNAHLGRGLALLSIGKDMEAQKDFDKFLELAPDKKAELEESIAKIKRQR